MNDEVELFDGDDSIPGDGQGERIAKVLARAGLGSRRDAERMITARRVAVNGTVLSSPAYNVLPGDVVSVDGEALQAPQEARLWRYHKPSGLVTTHKDPQGRTTVFDVLPKELPHVVSVGRLDLNSEGLLLLTNDGALAGMLEHPSTGWPRRYRVRMHGRVDMNKLASLADGVEVDGVQYGPIQVTFERQQGMNAWLQVTLHEGKNREIRRVMEHLGYTVNRLIRVSYGPFVIGRLQKGQVEEVPFKVLREALAGMGDAVPPELRMDKIDSSKWAKAKPRPVRPGYKKVQRAGTATAKPEGDNRETRATRPQGVNTGRPQGVNTGRPQGGNTGRPQGERPFDDRPRGPRPDGDRPQGGRPFNRQDRDDRDDRPFGDKPRGPRPDGDRPQGGRPFNKQDRDNRDDRPFGDKPRGPRPDGGRPQGGRPFNKQDHDNRDDRPFGDKPRGPRPDGGRPQGGRPFNKQDRDNRDDRPFGDKPRGPRPDGDRPQGGRPQGGRAGGPRSNGPRSGGAGKGGR